MLALDRSDAFQSVRWSWDPIPLLESLAAQRRPVTAVRTRSGRLMVLHEPAAVELALRGPGVDDDAAPDNDVLRPIVGDHSVLTTAGAEHRGERRVLRSALRDVEQVLEPAVTRVVAELVPPAGWTGPLLGRIQVAVADLLLELLHGAPGAPEQLDLLLDDVRHSRSRWRHLRRSAPWPRLARRRPELDRLLQRGLRLAADPTSPSLARLLQAHRPEAGSDAAVRAALATVLVTGHETTAAATAWTVERLLHEPGLLHRVTACPGDRRARLVGVVKEALRLRPVIPVLTRRLAFDLQTSAGPVPAGTPIALPAWTLHRDPVLHRDPLAFREDRFATALPPAAWFPFGGGSRGCVGAQLAVTLTAALVDELLRRCAIRAAGPAEPPRRGSILLLPGRGARVSVTDRLD